MQRKVNSTLVKGNGCIPLGTAVRFIKRKKRGGSKARVKKKLPEWSARRVLREEPKSVSIPRLPSLPDLRGRMNGTFYHEAVGVSEWEESILRYGVVLVAK